MAPPRVFPGTQVAAAMEYIAKQLLTMEAHGGAPALTLDACERLLGNVLSALPVREDAPR
jgi:hypothetical protein